MARVIAICNQKGGVGKTTTSVNIGAYLALTGKKTLLVDFDPQGNASSALGLQLPLETPSVYHAVIGDVEPDAIIRNSPLSNLQVMPATAHLAGLLVELVNMPEREICLRKSLSRIRHHYDYILIDLPPSLSLLTINGLVAADDILIPIQCEYYSLEGLGQLLETINLIKENFGHNLNVAGAILTMYDKRERLAREVAKEIRDKFPYPVFNTEIPRSIALAEAPGFSKPVCLYAPQSPGSIAYENLTKEIVARYEDPANNLQNSFGNLI